MIVGGQTGASFNYHGLSSTINDYYIPFHQGLRNFWNGHVITSKYFIVKEILRPLVIAYRFHLNGYSFDMFLQFFHVFCQSIPELVELKMEQ